MNIIEPYARMLPLPSVNKQHDCSEPSHGFCNQMGIELLKHVEWCARISHRSEDKITSDSYERIIRTVVLQHGDWSVTEHSNVSVDFYVDRGITHEIVRHRLFAYTQESTRFVNYEKKMPPSFVDPFGLALETNLPIIVHEDLVELDRVYAAQEIWEETISVIERAYSALIKAGFPPQISRSVFPNSLASRLIVTGNLRNWRHFFLMRTSKEAHPQMRQVTIPLLGEFKEKIPILYEDIDPFARQIDNLKKGR